MNFDQMLESWKSQDDKPIYGVNADLLQLVLQGERADIRRELRREQWTTYGMGTGMGVAAGLILWAFLYFRGPVLFTVLAAAGTAAFAWWIAALWLSLRRQRWREREFGNTLREELARNLSLLDYQLSRYGRWGAAMKWVAPAMVGTGLLYWLTVEINFDEGESRWEYLWMVLILVWAAVFLPRASSREVTKKLEPRRQRLRELLETLDAGQ
jgi:hypothetical protein